MNYYFIIIVSVVAVIFYRWLRMKTKEIDKEWKKIEEDSKRIHERIPKNDN